MELICQGLRVLPVFIVLSARPVAWVSRRKASCAPHGVTNKSANCIADLIRFPLRPRCCSPATSEGIFLFPLQFCRFFTFPAKFPVYSGRKQKTPELPLWGTLVQRTKQRRNALEPVSNCQVRHHCSAGGRDVRHGAACPPLSVKSAFFHGRSSYNLYGLYLYVSVRLILSKSSVLSLVFYSVKYCIASARLPSILTSRCRWLPVTRPVCPT